MLARHFLALSYHLGQKLCRFQGKPIIGAIERCAGMFHRCLNNVDFNMATNGENRLLQVLKKTIAPKCIFDVGANVGEWSSSAAALYPACTIHAFEIVPATYDILARNTQSISSITLNNFGLSDKEGDLRISLGEGSSTATGCKIVAWSHHKSHYSGEITGHVRTAIDYMAEQKLGPIDFVKIDVEGMDLRVIRGFGAQLANVRALQFEYGVFNIGSRDLLADFYQHLRSHGFVVGKIFPRVVKFCDYHVEMENFYGGNHIAIRANEGELIRKLSQYRKDDYRQ